MNSRFLGSNVVRSIGRFFTKHLDGSGKERNRWQWFNGESDAIVCAFISMQTGPTR
jgi:hypothetical protein